MTEDEKVQKALDGMTVGLPKLEAELAAIEIKTQADSERVADLVAKAKRAGELALKIHEKQVAPHQEKVDQINGIWRPIVKGFAAIVKNGKDRVATWIAEEKRRRLEKEQEDARALREQQLKQQAAEKRAAEAPTAAERVKAEIEAGRAFQAQQSIISNMPEDVPTVVKTGDITISSTQDWDFEVLSVGEFAAAHPGCVEVKRGETLKLVRLAAKEGRTIPGLRIVETSRNTAR